MYFKNNICILCSYPLGFEVKTSDFIPWFIRETEFIPFIINPTIAKPEDHLDVDVRHDPYTIADFTPIIATKLPMSFAMNSTSRQTLVLRRVVYYDVQKKRLLQLLTQPL